MGMKDGMEENGDEVEREPTCAGELEAREVDKDPGMVSLAGAKGKIATVRIEDRLNFSVCHGN